MTADTVGGVWTYAIDLARALAESGVEIALATMGARASEDQRQQAGEIPALELFESTYRLPWMEQPWADVQLATEWLLELAARIRPDIVHLNEPVFGSAPWMVPTLAVAHSCVVSWWQSVWGTAPPEEWSRYQREMSRGLRAAHRVVAPSRWMLEAVQRNYGVAGGLVIPNGRDAANLYPESKDPVVFAAGRLWDQAKNLQVLEQVANRLTWPVHVAGEPCQPGSTRQFAAEHLRLMGQLSPDAVAASLRRASIYAFPARYEPFGLSVLEAALAGCALVLGDLPTLRELWDGAAVFVPPDQPEDLRAALEGLIEDAALRQALAMRARRRALRYTPSRMGHAYLEVYADLLSPSRTIAEEPACAS
jgi:glycosyltransferase involved in cell wall biosynthesis